MDDFRFDIVAEDAATGARAGLLQTPHGAVETPVFMPVGTRATVKTLNQQDLLELAAAIVLANFTFDPTPSLALLTHIRDIATLFYASGFQRHSFGFCGL